VWRSCIAIFGICAIAWAIEVIPTFRIDTPLTEVAERILSGEKFNAAQLGTMKRLLDEVPAMPVEASALNSAAVIRLRLLEGELQSGNHQPSASSVADLQGVVAATLARSPTSSFIWLTDVWLKRFRAEATDFNLLRMSYRFGPNEAWIALRRSPVVLGIFLSLPGDLAEQALSEFAGLVRSNFFADAGNILAGPGWAVHEQLLNRLAQIDEPAQRRFMTVLASKDLDYLSIPGLAERPARPFERP